MKIWSRRIAQNMNEKFCSEYLGQNFSNFFVYILGNATTHFEISWPFVILYFSEILKSPYKVIILEIFDPEVETLYFLLPWRTFVICYVNLLWIACLKENTFDKRLLRVLKGIFCTAFLRSGLLSISALLHKYFFDVKVWNCCSAICCVGTFFGNWTHRN